MLSILVRTPSTAPATTAPITSPRDDAVTRPAATIVKIPASPKKSKKARAGCPRYASPPPGNASDSHVATRLERNSDLHAGQDPSLADTAAKHEGQCSTGNAGGATAEGTRS